MATLEDTRDALHRLISGETGLEAMLDARPSWYGRLLTGLTLAIGDDQIVYLGAAMEQSELGFTFRVGAFTPDTIAVGEARGGAVGEASVTTKLQRRADLVRLEIAGGIPAFDPTEFSEWPGKFRLKATYGSGLELTIPSSVVDTDQKRASLDHILDGLRNDLKH
ncbi:hypothetical protein ACIRCZ_18125 [Leifsonia sp. NPDC102414]|jgi:hypothetical protein|uniref:hypothetical protein n=1 Tax=unclassified Leifsonia TaxID=2663824 RepID=UPI000A4A6D2F|nr:hypothetical protein [Leifsonia sp. Root227]